MRTKDDIKSDIDTTIAGIKTLLHEAIDRDEHVEIVVSTEPVLLIDIARNYPSPRTITINIR